MNLKKKSIIFAVIAVVCIAVAMYFVHREALEDVDIVDDYSEIEDEPKPQRRKRNEKQDQPVDQPVEQPVEQSAEI